MFDADFTISPPMQAYHEELVHLHQIRHQPKTVKVAPKPQQPRKVSSWREELIISLINEIVAEKQCPWLEAVRPSSPGEDLRVVARKRFESPSGEISYRT